MAETEQSITAGAEHWHQGVQEHMQDSRTTADREAGTEHGSCNGSSDDGLGMHAHAGSGSRQGGHGQFRASLGNSFGSRDADGGVWLLQQRNTRGDSHASGYDQDVQGCHAMLPIYAVRYSTAICLLYMRMREM